MIKTSQRTLDEIDRAILSILQAEGNIKDADLARRIKLSAPATHARIRRLEQDGFITGYRAEIDRDKVGFGLMCFVQISLLSHQHELESELRDAVVALPEVVECYQVTGQSDYLLKVVLRDRKHLEAFLNKSLTSMLKDVRMQTSVVLTEIKATHALPL
jgi:Lrp/AsnC family transcriptional regulator, leucine-responsive regulatory protein